MENYKIKVNDEAESKEAQELFFELGFIWRSSHKEVTNLDATYIYEKDGLLTAGFNDLNFAEAGHQEITLPQLRDLVAKEKGLISGADALRALANGEDVEFFYRDVWDSIGEMIVIDHFMSDKFKFRLKPRTVKIELEIPAPFEPKLGEEAWCLDGSALNGYRKVIFDDFDLGVGFWHTEEEIKQVVAVWRGGLSNERSS